MRRACSTDEHEQFWTTARAFCGRVCVSHAEEWERTGRVSPAAWRQASCGMGF